MKTEASGELLAWKLFICSLNCKKHEFLHIFLIRKLSFLLFPLIWKVDVLVQDWCTELSSNHTFIYPSIPSHLSVTGVTLILCDASSQTIIRYFFKSDDVCRLAVVFVFIFCLSFFCISTNLKCSCVLCVCAFKCMCRSQECLTWSWSTLSYITLVSWRPSISGRRVIQSDCTFTASYQGW